MSRLLHDAVHLAESLAHQSGKCVSQVLCPSRLAARRVKGGGPGMLATRAHQHPCCPRSRSLAGVARWKDFHTCKGCAYARLVSESSRDWQYEGAQDMKLSSAMHRGRAEFFAKQIDMMHGHLIAHRKEVI
jgi:hypothetical protein